MERSTRKISDENGIERTRMKANEATKKWGIIERRSQSHRTIRNASREGGGGGFGRRRQPPLFRRIAVDWNHRMVEWTTFGSKINTEATPATPSSAAAAAAAAAASVALNDDGAGRNEKKEKKKNS